MALTAEERCATCNSGDPRQNQFFGETCEDPYHASAWDDDCPRCNYDTHVCRGCGEPLPHGTEVCAKC